MRSTWVLNIMPSHQNLQSISLERAKISFLITDSTAGQNSILSHGKEDREHQRSSMNMVSLISSILPGALESFSKIKSPGKDSPLWQACEAKHSYASITTMKNSGPGTLMISSRHAFL